ncbi:MAG: CRTAC1 family protein [Planctomycetota bacterium]
MDQTHTFCTGCFTFIRFFLLFIKNDYRFFYLLFINNQNGTFTNQATTFGLTTAHYGKGVAVADYDDDGFLDIFVTSAGDPGFAGQPGKHRLYRNVNGVAFMDVAAAAGVQFSHPTVQDGWGSCFGDYDLDGDLDLFVAGVASANSGSKLFQNNGNGTFTDVTVASQLFLGVAVNMHAFAPRFLDTNGDRYPELLLVADFGTSRYFKNNGDGTFSDWTFVSGTGHEENGMGQTSGDFDGDGAIDWYVTSIYQPPTNWTGNKLYLNNGNHMFSEVSALAGVDQGAYGWGAVAADFDLDGDLDIAETNGGLGQFSGIQSFLWLKDNATFTYTENALALGLNHTDEGRGMLNFDYDNDGDQDLMIFSRNDPMMLFRNDLTGPNTAWLRIFLDTSAAPLIAPHGIGALVYVTVGTTTQVRTIDSGDNYLSKSELSAHFGLGAATVVNEVRVEWPNGETTTQLNVPVNQTLTISSLAPPAFTRGDPNVDAGVNIADAIAILGALFDVAPPAYCEAAADTNSDAAINIADPVFLLTYLFGAGPAPAAPFPACVVTASAFACATACP